MPFQERVLPSSDEKSPFTAAGEELAFWHLIGLCAVLALLATGKSPSELPPCRVMHTVCLVPGRERDFD